MKSFLKKHGFSIALALLSVACMIACWAIAWKAEGNELIVPSMQRTFNKLFKLFTESAFWSALAFTLLRTLLAVAVSFLLAVVCAVIGVAYAPFKAFFTPFIAVFRVVPTMAITLILILKFPSQTPIIVTTLVVSPMLYTQLNAAIGGIDGGLLTMARAYSLSRRTTLTKIVLPQIAPVIISQLGAVISFALKLTISAEVIAFEVHGLGDMIKTANFEIEIARMAALTLVSVIIGLMVELCFYVVDRYTFKWRRSDANK